MQLADGYKQTEVGVIPEDWESAFLGDVADIRMCKRIFSDQTNPTGDIPFFKIGTFGGIPDVFIPFALYHEYRWKYSFPSKGDILLSAAGTLGKTVVYDGHDAYFQDSNIVWLDVNKQRIANEYLYQCYQQIEWASPEGSTISRLYNGIIRATKIPLPPLAEQRAIAEALSNVDALINALDALITKKRHIKQGTMQQLLTGKKRLPGFSGEWEEKTLGDLGHCIRGVSYNGSSDLSSTDTDCTCRLLRSNNVQQHQIVREDMQFVNHERVSEHQKLRDSDIVICMANGSKTLVGKAGLFRASDSYEYTFGAFMGCFRTEPARADAQFVSLFLQSGPYRQFLQVLLAGSSINNLKPSDIESIDLRLPDAGEQAAISEVLSDMDAEITALEQKRDKTKLIKQGMMQELLTGKTRLI